MGKLLLGTIGKVYNIRYESVVEVKRVRIYQIKLEKTNRVNFNNFEHVFVVHFDHT